MDENKQEDEISLIDLIAVLLHYKWMIIIVSFLAAVFSVVIAVVSIKMDPEKSFLPNQYTSKADMLIKESSSGGGLSSALSSSGLSGLASLAGVNVGAGGSSNAKIAEYLVSSNELLDTITEKYGLIEKYKIEEHVKANSRKALQKVLKCSSDDSSGVFTISFTDRDPEFAKDVANFALDWVGKKFDELGLDNNKIKKTNLERNIELSFNEILKIEKEIKNLGASAETGASAWNIPSITTGMTKLQLELEAQKQVYTQLKTQYELLKVQMQSETPVFQILSYPEIPDMKSAPSRGKLCIIITFAGFFMSIFLAFALNAWKNIKNDPEAVEKLQLKTRK